jgi:hypothetical protein
MGNKENEGQGRTPKQIENNQQILNWVYIFGVFFLWGLVLLKIKNLAIFGTICDFFMF